MTIRQILVPLVGSDDDGVTLAAGLMVGKQLNAHVEAMHASVDPRDAVAFVGEGMTSLMIEKIIDAADTEGQDRASRVLALFGQLAGTFGATLTAEPVAQGFSAGFVRRVGHEDDLMAERGRLADLIVASKPKSKEEPGHSPLLEAALRETGRPVLVVPGPMEENFGRVVAIAWNGSMEGARAVTFALPILERAARVVILSVADEASFGPGAADAAAYLAWHGITATVVQSVAKAPSPGRVLLHSAAEQGADLMVMGAYTRSRMRRLIFGGVTADVLFHTTIPVLMAH